MGVLKTSSAEQEQHVIYKIFMEGLAHRPQAFPIIYNEIQSKLSQVLLNSQNEEIVQMVHDINFTVNNSVKASQSSAQTKQLLQKLGFSGLAEVGQFDVKKK